MDHTPAGRPAPDLAALREEYTLGGLAESDVDPDPLVMLRRWVDDAVAAQIAEPTAMVLSTVDATGRVASRTVLLKGLDERGVVFFSHYTSRKGEELAGQPQCAVHLGWYALERQVRLEGRAERLPESESDAYFASRPRGSQLGAWASPQSTVVEGREALEARYAEAEARFAGGDVPRPPYWGGVRVVPDRVELWQGRPSRMHDRLRYSWSPTQHAWALERLAP
ncbi:pyridoxamine 5'-phosphate oxidase [Nocardioides sp. HDW12B]|uniref:pyridoxamine 5'-phosphate oxidase n=1 Tax=Nocardioides sp. HDW12B TaxID=2714939 RepID=UPI001F0E688E|nr:pyridoxamine 5'-phosphate oxidase [Nocardioides sp. HDW12B]